MTNLALRAGAAVGVTHHFGAGLRSAGGERGGGGGQLLRPACLLLAAPFTSMHQVALEMTYFAVPPTTHPPAATAAALRRRCMCACCGPVVLALCVACAVWYVLCVLWRCAMHVSAIVSLPTDPPD